MQMKRVIGNQNWHRAASCYVRMQVFVLERGAGHWWWIWSSGSGWDHVCGYFRGRSAGGHRSLFTNRYWSGPPDANCNAGSVPWSTFGSPSHSSVGRSGPSGWQANVDHPLGINSEGLLPDVGVPPQLCGVSGRWRGLSDADKTGGQLTVWWQLWVCIEGCSRSVLSY